MVLSFKSMDDRIYRTDDTGRHLTRRLAPGSGRNRRRFMRAVGLALMLVLARPADAHAYVDPSTAGYFFQWLLAGILGAAFALRMFWRNLKSFFTRSSSKSKKTGSEQDRSNP